jgi:calcineurin-like phosphoesterase family protein
MKDGVIDPFYFNVSVEQTDFRPMLFEEVVKRIQEQQGEQSWT